MTLKKNEIENQINEFIYNTEKAKENLLRLSRSINQKNENILKHINDIEEFIKYKENEKEIYSSISFILDWISLWKEEIEKFKRKKTFINRYEKEFIVLVFGKVNAGKSSLGNFIKGDFIKKHLSTDYEKFGKIPVTVEDKGYTTTANHLEEIVANKNHQFGENSTEATSTIQSFRIGGLAWVDTPGIGSITKENEKLAKEYVNDADLVIYLTSSDSPGTNQDFEELKSLQDREKPILLVISKSDKNDYLRDENGKLVAVNGRSVKIPVAKTPDNRKQQEDYLREVINENNFDNILKCSDIISISTQVAKYSIENKKYYMFESSNIGLIYNKIIETLSDNIEQETVNSKIRINSFIDKIIYDDIDEILKKIEQNKYKLHSKNTYEEYDTNTDSINRVIDKIILFKNDLLIEKYYIFDSNITTF